MVGFEVRGVPRGLARDAWWMMSDAPDGPSGAINGVPARWAVPGAAVLAAVALVVLADLLIWQVTWPGLSLAVFAMAVAFGAELVMCRIDRRSVVIAGSGLIVGLLPLVELAQALSVMFGVLGLSWALVWLALGTEGRVGSVMRGVIRFPVASLGLIWADGVGAMKTVVNVRPDGRGLWSFVQGWGLTLGMGAVFAGLLALGNPVLDVWLAHIADALTFSGLDEDRVLFWAVMALLIWPALRLAQMRRLDAALPFHMPRGRAFGLFTPQSVIRALTLFNAIFALQTGLDATYLWGGLSLPDGMTYASYAHRGAYPLLATALLAGLFALLTQPFWAGSPILRTLLAVWVAQNVILVASSALRLEMYVEVYGLTRLRFAAFVWMGLVAAGLGLMLVQMTRGRSVPWLMARSVGLAGLALYALCFFNVDGYVARHNLSHATPDLDTYYICTLGVGAAPAIAAHRAEGGYLACQPQTLRAPADWREWGYRAVRLRHSLDAVAQAADPPNRVFEPQFESQFGPQGESR